MLPQTLKTLFNRDLTKLKKEMEAYQDETLLWVTEKNISNSAGNLCLHLVGNLKHFIGHVLGHTGYQRNRELEFSQKNIPRDELIIQVDETIKTIDQVLDTISEDQLTAEYPLLVFADKMSTHFFLVHLAGHLSYHLGQINYHRRLLDL